MVMFMKKETNYCCPNCGNKLQIVLSGLDEILFCSNMKCYRGLILLKELE
jgi:hypothetical protein